MGKLFQLKQWLTVPEAAGHLSSVLSEPVAEADVLRLGLDGHLKLSVNFVNHARGCVGRVVPLDEAKIRDLSGIAAFFGRQDGDEFNTPIGVPARLRARLEEAKTPQGDKPLLVVVSPRLDDDRYLLLEDDVTTIEGVWDLPLIGSERLDVEHRFQSLIEGPAVSLINIEGTFVERANGQWCRLMERVGESDIPAGGLPSDALWVVRTEALREFLGSLGSRSSTGNEAVLSPKERNYLLRIIRVIAAMANLPKESHKAAGMVVAEGTRMAVALGERAVAEKLKAARDLYD